MILLAWVIVWIVSVLPLLIASIPSSEIHSFRELISSMAGRGKILHPSSQKFTVPQKFFAHFYVIGVIWTTFLLATTWIYAFKMAPLYSEEFQLSAVGNLSFEASYRVYLCIQNIALLLGCTFLVISPEFLPLSLCSTIAQEVARFVGNQLLSSLLTGKAILQHLSSILSVSLSPLMKLGSLQWIGGAIFLWGWIHQRRCHKILGSLWESASQAKEYIIPYGDWFEMVSCPHYLAEIVLYAGLLIASGGTDITIWLLFGFVVANLTYPAAETHRWYLQKFEDYPVNLHAIFPYVY